MGAPASLTAAPRSAPVWRTDRRSRISFQSFPTPLVEDRSPSAVQAHRAAPVLRVTSLAGSFGKLATAPCLLSSGGKPDIVLL